MVMGATPQNTQVVIIGAGPGGYVAALRAADLGLDVALVESREKQGGVCLIEGCIPSKTLINAVELADQAKNGTNMGVNASGVEFDLDALRKWTNTVVDNLTGGVAQLLKARGVDVIKGYATFKSNNEIALQDSAVPGVKFEHCIIATGSRVRELPWMKEVDGIWSSVEALQIPEVPNRLLVIGGGYIGLELGEVYAGLGSEVHMVEMLDTILATADQDLVRVVQKHAKKAFKSLRNGVKVTDVKKEGDAYQVTIEEKGETKTEEYDRILVSIGRVPNTDNIGLENTDIKVGDGGLIEVDAEMRTSVNNVYAIGDCVPGFALAHKASREGKIAAEVIAGEPAAYDNRSIPAVVFTHPELAWTGLTEQDAKQQGREVTVGKFPLSALGRARTMGQTDGMVKVIGPQRPRTHPRRRHRRPARQRHDRGGHFRHRDGRHHRRPRCHDPPAPDPQRSNHGGRRSRPRHRRPHRAAEEKEVAHPPLNGRWLEMRKSGGTKSPTVESRGVAPLWRGVGQSPT